MDNDISTSVIKGKEPGFWFGEKYITHMESEVEPIHEKSMNIPKKVLQRWMEILRGRFNQSIDK